MHTSLKHITSRGFTIVELLIVIIVIGILATIGIVTYNGLQGQARDKAVQSDIDGVENEVTRYGTQNSGVYGSSIAWNSTTGTNPNIQFTLSAGDVIIVTTTQDTYCIKGYNPTAKTYNSISTAQQKESTPGACFDNTLIAAGGLQTCAISSAKQAYCWGYNGSGQLGNATNTNSPVPVAVSTAGVLSGKSILSISAGSSQSCAITTDHNAYCWGLNGDGQLGNGSTSNSNVPVAVSTAGVLAGKTMLSLKSGSSRICGLASDNQAYCWGYNNYGQLGNNSTTSSSVPVAVYTSGVLSGKKLKAITAGYSHNCAIASDNQAYCWGLNDLGELGNNTTTNSSVPVAVNTSGVLAGKTIKSISAGNFYTCVLASDSQIYCWGYNDQGQLGNNTYTQSLVPVAVNTSGVLAGKTITSIATGTYSVCAIASDNQAYCWGNNDNGQLGNNSLTKSPVPVAVNTSGVLSGKTLSAITSGFYQTCALASDSKEYCWGYNNYGQLGNNSTTSSSVPVLVTGLSF